MLKPIGNRVLVRPDSPNEETVGGIIIPKSAQSATTTQGVVVAVGEAEVQVEDVVLWSKHAGTDVEIEGVLHLVLNEEDILGVLT